MGMVADWIQDAVMHLVGKVKEAAAGIVGKVLATFGLTTVSFTAVVPQLKSLITQYTSALDGPAAQLLGYLGVGIVISMILSALTVRMAWKVFIVPTSVANQLQGGG